ncbi:uncharacterized protein LOC131431491 isoform X2 [Malaya genurostris]|uniref:uncharacterized protein LOC131431491 isoform X2 n=1 Tax=Malaya genurostris TaxID=325434 RepID=UPI0026F3C6B4|nr:uncharacterized protein LOC131431491 isoform X2 [Malaya genurostris]
MCLTRVDGLPDEMLEKIFSYLSFEYLRTVTTICRRWNYLTARLVASKAQLVVKVENNSTENCRQALLASQRNYKQILFWFIDDASSDDGTNNGTEIHAISELLCRMLMKFGPSIKTLILHQRVPNEIVELATISRALSLCPNLEIFQIDRVLFYETDRNQTVKFDVLPSLQEFNNRSNLLDWFEFDLKVISPNLTRFRVNLMRNPKLIQCLVHFQSQITELHISCEFPESKSEMYFFKKLKFPRLEKLSMMFAANGVSMQPIHSFLKQHNILKEVLMEQQVKADVLKSLASSRKTLKRLSLNTQDFETLYLDNFECLEMFKLNYTYFKLPPSFDPSPMPVMRMLRHLNLYNVTIPNPDEFNALLRHAFPALETLELINICRRRTREYILSFYQRMLRGLVSLKRLTLSESEEELDTDLFCFLNTSMHLHELRLKFKKLSEYSFESETFSLQKMTLDVKQMSYNYLCKLLVPFPELSRIELQSKCLSTQEVNFARKKWPHCEIVCKHEIEVEILFPET